MKTERIACARKLTSLLGAHLNEAVSGSYATPLIDPSRRTVLRDIGALGTTAVLIHSDDGRAGGRQLDPQSLQTRARLSVPEVFGLLISVAAMRAAGNFSFSEHADAGLAKIEKTLPSGKVKYLRGFLECLHIGQLSPLQELSGTEKMDPDLLGAFEAAFLGRHFIRFDYSDAQECKTERQAKPQAMLILPPLWYLGG